MREYTIDKNNAGKRVDRWLSNELPALPMGLMQKFIRTKRIKVNGKGVQQNSRLNEGDVVLYKAAETSNNSMLSMLMGGGMGGGRR